MKSKNKTRWIPVMGKFDEKKNEIVFKDSKNLTKTNMEKR